MLDCESVQSHCLDHSSTESNDQPVTDREREDRAREVSNKKLHRNAANV